MSGSRVALLSSAAELLAGVPALAQFAPELEDLPEREVVPKALPMVSLLAETPALASAQTRPFVEALVAAAPALEWRQSYTEAQVGADYLSRYGWVNIASPDGHFGTEALRFAVGYWGKGLDYPRHWHEPEETYLVLAGGATFFTEGRAPVRAVPGTVIHHPSNIPHAMSMADAPLLALAVWTGQALTRVSEIEAVG